jgi:DNA-binding transcriptional MerR regulator
MQTALTIGDFSRITHLSVKTLRHYHRVELLEPSEVNEDTGYRYYSLDQVPTAQAIRRYRDLSMPIDAVKAVLAAPDVATRDRLISAHLSRLQNQLEQTQAAVSSLQALLHGPVEPLTVEVRTVPATTALAIREMVDRADLVGWWEQSFDELRRVVAGRGFELTGPAGGLFDNELFTDERGEATVFVSMASPPAVLGRARALVVSAAELAVAVHHGSHQDADRTYGALGTYVAEHGFGADGPVREYYLVDAADTLDVTAWQTEICWPIAT